jgi:hypothetical protein
MATKKAKQEVTITSPLITNAWKKVVEVTSKADVTSSVEVVALGNAIAKSALSRTDVKKVIRNSGLTSPIVSESHVEGLVTLAIYDKKFPEFKALALKDKLAKSTRAYKLLGVESAHGLASWEIVQAEVKKMGKAKNGTSTPKKSTSKKAKKASNFDVLESFSVFLNTFDFDNCGDNELDVLNDIVCKIADASTAQVDNAMLV